jgi:hypothetical protein
MITLTPLNNPEGVTQQEYNSSQEVLIPVVNSTSEFDPVTDKVIFSVESPTAELLDSKQIFKYTIRNYQNTSNEDKISSVVVYPENDIKETGYNEGNFNVYYNFYRTGLKSDEYKFFIQEISPSRTELRLSVNSVPNEEISSLVQEFQTQLEGVTFRDFYIEIEGMYYIANNILLDDTSVPNTILIKLYEPLPSPITRNTQLQVVFEVAETVGFNINFPPTPIQIDEDIKYIKGPNFNYQLSDQVNNSTPEQDYNSLISNNQLTSSYNELENILNQKGITVNIDYTNFDNFIHFSSAEQRLRNFYYKVGQIEDYNNNIALINSITGSTSSSLQTSSSRATYEAQITDIIKNFDGYENYLYYTSGALAYPKSNSTQPYTLQSTGSSEVLTWLGSTSEISSNYGGRLLTASFYDDENQDNLLNSIPNYLREDPANSGYELFLNMIGQHFDIIYSYINVVTEKYNTDNRLDYGISKDLVADALRGAGLKLYQNNFSSDNLYSALLGINASGSLLPPTGSEVINTYVTASNIAVPLENVNKQTYKRLYHNLPYILKKKGTVEGLRALINCYGIPDTILRISEFGGKDKNNINDWDYTHDRFSYSLYANASAQVVVPWVTSSFSSPNSLPQAISFRFKTDGYRDSESQMLMIKESSSPTNADFYIRLEHTGSGTLTSGSYSGSIQSQSADYGVLTFGIGNPSSNITSSVTLPFYNNDWWTVGLIKDRYDSYLYVGQKIYDGEDGWKIGYFASSSTPTTGGSTWINSWNPTGSLKFSNSVILDTAFSASTTLFKGSYQEIRLYNGDWVGDGPLWEPIVKDLVMNPKSLESLELEGDNSSFNTISFRAPLGGELRSSGSIYIPDFNITYNGGLPVNLPFSLPLNDQGFLTAISVHPAITASSALLITQSFGDNSNYTISASVSPVAALIGSSEYYYYDQTPVGIKNKSSEKIKNTVLSLPSSGDTLSPYRSIQQDYISQSNYTKDVNYVEVAFSPQNEINDDINSTLGYFNIGDYIGDPRQVSESVNSYPSLDNLRDYYFEKYYTNYNWKDYVRLIKYFDNSLFKMVQDFVPANSGLATGVVIKQHLLERNKQRPAQVESSQYDYSGSITTAFISGTSAGVYNDLISVSPQVTQSWTYTVDTLSGSLVVSQSTQDEFYNGELSGSNILATTGELNDENDSKYPSTLEINYDIIFYTSSVTPLNPFTNPNSLPNQGEIYLWYDTGSYIDTGGGSSPNSGPSSGLGG